MTISPGEEFKAVATPGPEFWLRLAYLEVYGYGGVLTPFSKDGGPAANRRASSAGSIAEMIRMARLADPDYQAMSVRINGDLDRMDENAVSVLQKIEHALIDLRLKRERLLEQTYRDENGRPIAMTTDGAAAFYVDEPGGRVDDETFEQIREYLVGRPPMDEFLDVQRQKEELDTLRGDIQAGMSEGERLRDDLAAGSISAEDAERRSQEIHESMAGTLSAAEAALLGVRDDFSASGADAPDLAVEDAVPLVAPPKPR